MSVLVIAEHNNKDLHPAVVSAINAARELSKDIVILVVGYNCKQVATKIASLSFVTKILYIDDIIYKYLYAEDLTEIVLNIINNSLKKYEYIISVATAFGKDVLPRIAGCLDVEQISEVTKIIDKDIFERFIYSGDAIQIVKLLCTIKCLTVRVGYFTNKITNNINPVNIEQLQVQLESKNIFVANNIKFLELITSRQSLNLTNARIVVAGGRALQNKDNFLLIEQLAKKLNAAIGATRTAVHAGFAPNEWQIGFSGKTIAPDVYFAIGISGAVQHVCGVKDSKIIVAINIDPDAPIFKIATYGIVGDLFKIVPELINAL